MHLPNVVGHLLHRGAAPGLPGVLLVSPYIASQIPGQAVDRLAGTRSVSLLARCRSSALRNNTGK